MHSSRINFILSLELATIYGSLLWVEHTIMHERQVAIFSDSLSALSAFRDSPQDHYIVMKIHFLLIKVALKSIRTIFISIPRHKEIGYNNIAHELAREVSSKTIILIPVLTPSEKNIREP